MFDIKTTKTDKYIVILQHFVCVCVFLFTNCSDWLPSCSTTPSKTGPQYLIDTAIQVHDS